MSVDFTKGKIAPEMIRFTLPLVFGNLLQLLYNAADSMIVGRVVGKEALAAVGTSNPLMTLVILFFNGITLGSGILIGTQYGAKDIQKLRRQISTTLWGGIVFSLVLSLLFIVIAVPIFRLMQVESSVFDQSVSYMRIIFLGLVFTFVYNCLASVLRSMGDSSGPLFFLMISALLNILGDLFFVAVLKLGVEGAAISTVICEGISCLLCFLYIHYKVPMLRMGKEWFVFDRSLFGQTLSYGLTSAMQQATVQLGKIGFQIIVNTMGVNAMAAFTIVNRIDDFAYTPQQNIGHAMTSFMAINRGAGKMKRVWDGFKKGMIIELCYGIVVSLVCFIFARALVSFSSTEEGVIQAGTTYLKTISFMYILPAMTNGIQGFFRGMGDLKITLISSMTNVIARLIAAAILVLGFGMKMNVLPFCCMMGWIGMFIVELPRLYKTDARNFAGPSS